MSSRSEASLACAEHDWRARSGKDDPQDTVLHHRLNTTVEALVQIRQDIRGGSLEVACLRLSDNIALICRDLGAPVPPEHTKG